MRLFVHHRTEYRFSEPQRRLIQMLRVTPSSFAGQQVIDWQLNVGCDVSMHAGRDGFGNETTMLYVNGPIEHLSLAVDGEVLTENRNGLVQEASETVPPILFLRSTPLTLATPEIRAFAREIADAEATVLGRAHRLMGALHDRIRFDPDDTHVHRDAGEAFAESSGVCQDHAHIFLAAAREIEIPARYVSGHLYRTDGAQRQPAAHAWIEAHIDNLGWVAFDATNCICPGDAYIRVAIGLDYRDAAPLSGSRSGGGTETLAVGVTVSQAQIQSQN